MDNKRLLRAPPHSVEDVDPEMVHRAVEMLRASPAHAVLVSYLKLRLHRHRFECSSLHDTEQVMRRQGRAAEATDLLALLSGGDVD